MATPLEHVFAQIRAADRELKQLACRPWELSLSALDQVHAPEGTFPLARHGAEAFRKLVNVPLGLLPHLRRETAQMVVADLWDGYRAGHGRPRLRRTTNVAPELILLIREGRVEGVVEVGLPRIENARIIDVLQSAFIARELAQASVRQCRIEPHGAFVLELSFQSFAAEPRVGDIVQAGVWLSHSPLGDQATQLSISLYRLACSNGMLVPICSGDRRARTRRDYGSPHSEQAVLTRLATLLADARRQMLPALEQLQLLTATPASPVDELRLIAGRRRFNRRLARSLEEALDADEAGQAGNSQYDVLQALSRVATHGGLPPRMQYDLLRYSGVYSQGQHYRRCPHCRSILLGRGPLSELN